ncbi:transposase [Streptomyces sp. NPDC056519]|uniref:transposase n=1 Tax=Streptomyces sp. NPDC056519 TaxID=3345849 RepID=UPI003687EBD9
MVRYIAQGSVEADPAHLREDQKILRDQLTAACPEMSALADPVRDFATMLTPASDNATALTGWITGVQAADLPFLHSYAIGLQRDRAAVDPAFTMPWHNGRTEGVNNKIKLIKRQTCGRVGYRLPRQRILLS